MDRFYTQTSIQFVSTNNIPIDKTSSTLINRTMPQESSANPLHLINNTHMEKKQGTPTWVRTEEYCINKVYDKCMSVYIFLLFFTLNWYLFDILVRKWYLISVYIDLNVKMKHKEYKRAKRSNVEAIW